MWRSETIHLAPDIMSAVSMVSLTCWCGAPNRFVPRADGGFARGGTGCAHAWALVYNLKAGELYMLCEPDDDMVLLVWF